MSGIYINGMEMPKYGCITCFLRTGHYCGIIDKDESVVEYARKNERHPSCPLIPVPDHGRLIDGDALVHSYYHAPSFPNLCKAINDAPTIIPADLPVMYYPQVDGITPTIIPADKEVEG